MYNPLSHHVAASARYTATTTEILRYKYALKDHLGNARLTFTDKNANSLVDMTNLGSTNEIIQESNYYPFGLDMPGIWMNDGGALDNPYKYNGKELNGDFGLGWYNYGKRWYEPAVGRFPSVDPIISDFPYVTPYNYAENEPVASIDLHGLQRYIVTNQYDNTQRISQTTITTVQNGNSLVNVGATNGAGQVQSDVLSFNNGSLPAGVPASQQNSNLSPNENAIVNAGVDNTRNFVNTDTRSDGLGATGGFTRFKSIVNFATVSIPTLPNLLIAVVSILLLFR